MFVSAIFPDFYQRLQISQLVFFRFPGTPKMSVFHDEVEIEDFEFDEEKDVYHYPCPCGDRFEIAR